MHVVSGVRQLVLWQLGYKFNPLICLVYIEMPVGKTPISCIPLMGSVKFSDSLLSCCDDDVALIQIKRNHSHKSAKALKVQFVK